MNKPDSSLLQRPLRGMKDFLAEDMRRYRHITDMALKIAESYGFEAIATPILESSDLFLRSLGEESDIVSKEMYRFSDQGGDDITLRPENTAGVLRALICAGLQQQLPQRFFYAGPMFRRERPQKGRLRQFHQCGVEILGCDQPLSDIEVILCARRFIETIFPSNAYPVLELNTIGDMESRALWEKSLKVFFEKNKADLSDISKKRLQHTPLRILDSKEKQDQAVIAEAPLIDAFLNEESRDFFDNVVEGLKALNVPFQRNPLLVRGLDYYGHTVFELKSDVLGAQSTVLAGGRYDRLSQILGGPAMAAVGWASGIERLMLCAKAFSEKKFLCAVIALEGEFNQKALIVCEYLRNKNINIALIYQGKVKQKMKQAGRMQADFVLLLGEEEAAADRVTLRNMQTGVQQQMTVGAAEAMLLENANRS